MHLAIKSGFALSLLLSTSLFLPAQVIRPGFLGCSNSALIILPSANAAAEGPRSAEELAKAYLAAFNKKDKSALYKLRYPLTVKSELQSILDEMIDAELADGTQFTSYKFLSVDEIVAKPTMGPDGNFYKPNLKPVHMLMLKADTKNGTTTTTVPIGEKDGIYYVVCPVPADGPLPNYKFGWQRFQAPKSDWSVLMPNEPEPGRQALEQQVGKPGLNDPDVYGVVKNTGDIKTTQHMFSCGEPGKRMNAADNQDTYTVSCTTYEPETLKKWFSDSKQNVSDAIDSCVRANDGKLIAQADLDKDKSSPSGLAKEFQIKAADGRLVVGHVYWLKDALFQLTVKSKKEKPDTDNYNKFLTSLEVK
jgi:hypothetical protein